MGKPRKTPHTHSTYTNFQPRETVGSRKLATERGGIILKKRSEIQETSSGCPTTKKSKSICENDLQSERISENDIQNLTNEVGENEASLKTADTSSNNKNKPDWLTELGNKRKKSLETETERASISPTKMVRVSENMDANGESILSSPQEANDNQILDYVVVREEGYKIPARSLREVFEYLGHKHEVTNGVPSPQSTTSMQAKCLLCQKVYSYQSPSTGGISNLTRHLKKCHAEKSIEIEKKIAAVHENSKNILHSWVHSGEKPKYQPSDVQQSRFSKSLLYCISKDKLPMSFVCGKGFQKLISAVDPKLSIPSRSTIQRRFKHNHETIVLPHLKETLRTVKRGIVSLDGWKSRRKDGILAFKIHFIDDDWNRRNLTIGIHEINESQTGDTIRKHFDDLIDRLDIRKKVAMVMTDSGANMVKAFKAPVINMLMENNDSDDTDDDELIEDVDLVGDDITLFCESESENEDEEASDEVADETDVYADLQPVLGHELQHLRCTSHQLQLAINKALGSGEASSFLAYMSQIINFFSNNTVYLAKLRKLAGKGLLKRALTRWNYWIDAVNRLCEDKVYQAVEKLLKLAHHGFKGDQKKRLPRKLKSFDKRKMKEFCMILKPFAELTDILQGDGVTSSILINSLVCKLKDVGMQEVRYFDEMRDEIISQITTRFGPIVNNPAFILATALDARMKLNVFKLKDTGGLLLPKYNEAKRVCEAFFLAKNHEIEVQASEKEPTVVKNFIDEINKQAEEDATIFTQNVEPEMDQYLKDPMIPSDSDILGYWRKKESQYPNLAAAAKFYLAIPASSGSVERLFSELTAIGRAKRACTQGPVFEQLVLHSQYVDEQMKLKH